VNSLSKLYQHRVIRGFGIEWNRVEEWWQGALVDRETTSGVIKSPKYQWQEKQCKRNCCNQSDEHESQDVNPRKYTSAEEVGKDHWSVIQRHLLETKSRDEEDTAPEE